MLNEDKESRRQFLKKMAALLTMQMAFSGRGANGADEVAATSFPFKVSNWTGDDFTLGHKLRIGEVPAIPSAPEKKVDFVIVGGGVSGLTAAHRLNDHDFLLLEQYDSTGGHARGGSFRGIDYSWGSAYTSTVDGISGELFSELKIAPVELPPERNSWYWQQKFCTAEGAAANGQLQAQYQKLLKEVTPVLQAVRKEKEGELSPKFTELDTTVFASALKDYSPEFIGLIDSYCRSSFCGGITQISSLAGYLLLEDLLTPSYVFKGGNPAIAKALTASVEKSGKGRMVTGSFVWKVEMTDTGASVIYSTADGACHRVDCKHVIVATSPMVAARQLVHVDNMLRAQLMMFKFGAYLVANCLMKKKIFDGSYDCFIGEPSSFTDITVAETPYMVAKEYTPDMGSVLTVYQPYVPGSAGRGLLLAGDRMAFAKQLSDDLEKLITTFTPSLEELVLTRWGHALAVVSPGYFGRLAKMKLLGDKLSFAHSSLAGGPYVEAAIKGGTDAATNALKLR